MQTNHRPRRWWLLAPGAGLGLGLLVFLPILKGSLPIQDTDEDATSPGFDSLLAGWSEEFFPGDPNEYDKNLTDIRFRQLERGRRVYNEYCVGCHGERGDGYGEAATMLVPRPRNFLYGADPESPPFFKFRSTASGEAPLRSDLERTIHAGLPGSSMPDHRLVDPSDIRHVAEYILWLAQTNEFRQALLLAYEDEEPDLQDEEEAAYFYEDFVVPEAERILDRYARPKRLSIGEETPNDEQSLARGEEIYRVQGCHECHGDRGRGDGSSAPDLQDVWGFPVDPRDFSTGSFRAGSEAMDIYLRIRGGVSGTPMPAYEQLDNREMWDLVHFVMSLSQEEAE